MAASIEDVARRAGVSIATVSRALRGLPDVAAGTRDRVIEAATALDYIASPFAARLASGRTKTVGVVVPFINRWFFAEVIGAVESALRSADYDLLLYNLGDEAGRDRFFEHMPLRKRVDAVLVASLVLTDAEAETLLSLRCPLGLLGLTMPGFLSTRIDDVSAATTAVQHLLGLGHERIGLIGGDTLDPMRYTPPLHRRTGYHAALTGAGIAHDPDLEVLGYFTIDGGMEACERLLSIDDPPTAIFAESDEMAYGALRVLRGRGVRVPEDIALMGFDDHTIAEVMDLTTVHQPVAEQALDVTTRLLIDVGEDGGLPVEDVVLPTELVVRGSTDVTKSVY
ncbi:LacI family DNA-binding transcriptional regulator [Jatrophihabitans sp.]|uniref:LacI family DNA-binding transcriptional regulator n=1 Tax=Jatrophihabitans sp. TaxID=1932789 RepID=UPI0030C6E7AF|nr:Transcriptional regulator, LacI family [Jatrophihabitans sp.]